jgi:hypothetical protein
MQIKLFDHPLPPLQVHNSWTAATAAADSSQSASSSATATVQIMGAQNIELAFWGTE